MSKLIKFRTIIDKLKNITIIPESGKYDSVLIWLHGVGDTAEGYMPVFHDHKLLGVNIHFPILIYYRMQK